MMVAINRFSSLDILQERVFGFVHSRLCGLDILHVAHEKPPRTLRNYRNCRKQAITLIEAVVGFGSESQRVAQRNRV